MKHALLCAAALCAFAETSFAQDAKGVTPDYIFHVKAAKFKTIRFSRFDFLNINGLRDEDLSPDFTDGTVVLSETGKPGELSEGTVEAILKGRDLIILTPPVQRPVPQGTSDTLLILTAKSGETRTVLIKSQSLNFGASVTTEFHNDPNPNFPALEVSGLSDNYVLGNKDLTLSFTRGSPFSPKRENGFEISSLDVETDFDTRYPQDVSSIAALSPHAPSLTIEAASLRDLNARLPSGPASLEFYLPQEGDLNSVTVQYFNGSVTVTGQLVDAEGTPIAPDFSETGPLELLVSLRGTDYRRIVPVLPDGSFTVDNLADGETYWLYVSDLRWPKFFSTVVRVPENGSDIAVTVQYAPEIYAFK